MMCKDWKRKGRKRSGRRPWRYIPAAGIVAVFAAVLTLYGVSRFAGSEHSSFLSGYGDRILAMERVQPNIELSGLNSEAAILLRVSDGQVLAQMNQEKRIYPASMTKMMTCIVAVESIDDLESEIRLPEEIFPALYEEGASMAGFLPGEHVKIVDLLYGIILPSGGECSMAVAEYAAGSEEAFVEMMNEKAREVGMENTHFENATGLQNENHYSTVKDLAVLLQYALQNSTFEEIFCSREHLTAPTDGHPEGLMLRSSMFRLQEDWTVGKGKGEIRGGKTGFTDEAGLCLASEAMIGDEKYIAVTAGAEGDHSTEPYHVMDAFYLYGQLDNRWQAVKEE